MISKNDCILLLLEIQNNGTETQHILNALIKQVDPSIEVIKFINSHRQLEVSMFYEKLRKSHNNKKSNLYINIVKEVTDPTEVLTTLSAMLTQILLFSKTLENKQMFIKHSRALEISKVLANYFKEYDITQALKLLRIVKADLKVLESFLKEAS